LKSTQARRYLQGSVHKIVRPTYLVPIASTQIQINTTALIGFTTLGALYLFQRAERKRWQNQYDGVIIASFSE